MPRTTATRRIALLASSSFGLAIMASAASLSLALMPTPAHADNECTPMGASGATPATNGATPDTYECSATTYATGITYDAAGNLSVTKTNTTTTTVTANGVNLTGDGIEALTWNSTAGTVTGGTGTAGPVISATSTGSGTITVNTANVTGSSSSITHGIYAASTGGGAVSVSANGTVTATSSTGTGSVPGGAAAIYASSTGGNGNVSVTANEAQGRLIGIYAQASGAGTLTITNSGTLRASTRSDAVAVDIVAGTGLVTVNSGPSGSIGSTATSSVSGTALRADYDGNAVFSLNRLYAGAGPAGSTWAMDLLTATGTTTTINLATEMRSTANPYGGQVLRVQGGGSVDFNIAGYLGGAINLAGAGPVDIDLADGARWRTLGNSVFGSGGDRLTINEGAYLSATRELFSVPLDTTQIDFGGGDDLMVNAGLLVVGDTGAVNPGGIDASGEADFRLLNLERFENSGLILMGTSNADAPQHGSDRVIDDLLFMSGTTFVGGAGGLIELDANLNGTQTACDTAQRDAVTGDLPAADCIRILNGATEGVTSILVHELVPGDRGSFSEIVLIDVSGGTSDVGHFVLDPGSDRYNAANGGVIDKGFFIFPLVYDADTQQHKLVAAVGQSALQFPLVGQAAHDLWRLSTGTWLDRQADLRGGLDEGVGGGVWMRVATEFTDRDVTQTVDVAGNPFSFDNTHKQNSYAVTGGLDLIAGGQGDRAWAAGLTAGYAHADLDFESTPNLMRLDGWTGGVYGSLIVGGLFVDATVTANRLQLESDVPGLNLFPAGTIVATNLLSVGGQVEAGWRFPIMEAAFIEPLAGVSYVRTTYDDLVIGADDPLRPPLVLEYDDPTSLRANLGGRLGLDQDYGSVRAQYSLLGRVWEEFEDESRVVVHNTGADATMLDEFIGRYSEFGVGASLWALDGAVSGFVNFGGKFADDYTSQNLAAGVRVNW